MSYSTVQTKVIISSTIVKLYLPHVNQIYSVLSEGERVVLIQQIYTAEYINVFDITLIRISVKFNVLNRVTPIVSKHIVMMSLIRKSHVDL